MQSVILSPYTKSYQMVNSIGWWYGKMTLKNYIKGTVGKPEVLRIRR